MQLKKALQFGLRSAAYTASVALVMTIFSVTTAKAPQIKKLSDADVKASCALLSEDAKTGIEYADRIVGIVIEQDSDSFTKGFFDAFAMRGPADETKIGQNLYMGAYVKVSKEPLQKAIKNTAQAAGLSEKDTWAVINGAIDIIKLKKGFLSLDEAQKEAEQLRNLYNEQLKLSQLESDLQGFIQPLEIFSDGDVTNSGFDLMQDLDLIDYILFFDRAKKSSGAGTNNLSERKDEQAENNNQSGTGSSTTSPKPSATPQTSAPASPQPTTTASPQPTAKPYAANPQENRLQCFADSNLNSEINKKLNETLALSEEARNQNIYDDALNSNTQQALIDGSDIKYPEDQNIPPATNNDIEKQKEEDNIICNEWVCFEVDFIMKKQSLFTDRANCVACHVEKARDLLDKVISKNLVPNKLTGNVMEAAKCSKNASLASIAMNVITIWNPIQTPPNTNQVGTENMIDYNNLLTAALGGDYYDQQQKRFISNLSQIQSQVLKSQPSDTPAEVVADQVNAAVNQAQADAQRKFEEIIGGNKVFNKADYYQAISGQIEYMNAYFKAMQQSFVDVNKEVCGVLRNKPVCQ